MHLIDSIQILIKSIPPYLHPIIIAISTIVVIVELWIYSMKSLKGRLLSSTNKFYHTLGSLLTRTLFIGLIVIAICLGILYSINDMPKELYQFSILLISVSTIIYIAAKIRKILILDVRSQTDTFNFVIQTIILGCIIAFIIGCFIIFQWNTKILSFSVITTLIGFIFLEPIKSVVSFYHMYWNDLIHLGDWIKIPSKNIDGKLIDITLMNATIKNWDETISTIPTIVLQTEHTNNLRNILSGRTLGRRMIRKFSIDTSTVRGMNHEEIIALSNRLQSYNEDTVWLSQYLERKNEAKSNPVLNITLFRKHLHHWLMNHDRISRNPRLLVRFIDEPTIDGLPLELYLFLTEHNLQAFELLQAEIVEYVILSMEWFGLHLHQRPTGFDIKNVKIDKSFV